MRQFIPLLLPLMISCQSGQVEKLQDGLIMHLSDSTTRLMQIRILADDIIHVIASPEDKLENQSSLIAENPNFPFQGWSYDKKGDSIIISTKKLRTEVSLRTGKIVFKDAEGNAILGEPDGGGKSFIPLDNISTYAIQQVFESPDDEAFYGLGQHQNRQMNYKGADVELAQHNIVAVVPFLLSSRNYGILWDNYSITRFGDAREYQSISSLNLYSRDDHPGGLTASYYHKDKLVLSRQENIIDYQYIESSGKVLFHPILRECISSHYMLLNTSDCGLMKSLSSINGGRTGIHGTIILQ